MFGYARLSTVLLFMGCSFVLTPSALSAASLPTVDLGYAIYQANNICYAAPPVGQLRFAAPAKPVKNRSAGVQDGSYGKVINGGSPAGLLQRSREGNSKGVIYVAMNYRLGAFGFLSGTTLQANGSATLALLISKLP
ncbi:hypothetical protein NA56DRAFT_709621 [Hyaloscypha hepaticicola]|uniref:Uncharacterized protein n=1 Tax=Hyaloscypha hepaticicola TaxID=2082293 RepID=A0A2J6PNZ5_9HELO|nr:hypothetical protein NA56DRAFT_709621 [Hyaloscypha hepaticicola]